MKNHFLSACQQKYSRKIPFSRCHPPTFRLREIFRKLPIDFLRQGLTIPHINESQRQGPANPEGRNLAESPQNPTDLGYYAMMQIGVEMAAPVALGYWGDSFWGCFPWLTAVGAVLGLVFGLVAVTRVGRDNSLDERKPQLPEDGK